MISWFCFGLSTLIVAAWCVAAVIKGLQWRAGRAKMEVAMVSEAQLPVVDKVIVGFRQFTISQGRLQGQFNRLWDTALMQATCCDSPEQCAKHLATSFNGDRCGIYAYRKNPATGEPYGMSDFTGSVHVDAVVTLWGNIIPAERGYRAQFCRIESLVLVGPNDELFLPYMESLRARYKVPVSFKDMGAPAVGDQTTAYIGQQQAMQALGGIPLVATTNADFNKLYYAGLPGYPIIRDLGGIVFGQTIEKKG